MDTHTNKPRLYHNKQKLAIEAIPTGWFDGATLANGTRSGAGGLIKFTQNFYYIIDICTLTQNNEN